VRVVGPLLLRLLRVAGLADQTDLWVVLAAVGVAVTEDLRLFACIGRSGLGFSGPGLGLRGRGPGIVDGGGLAFKRE
jgi:hypothetical protein